MTVPPDKRYSDEETALVLKRAVELEARLIASASADLEQAVTRELFRRDLFHRLGVFWIRLPPLRERLDDIVPLAELFLEKEVARRVDFPQMRYRSSRLMRGRETYGSSRASSSTG